MYPVFLPFLTPSFRCGLLNLCLGKMDSKLRVSPARRFFTRVFPVKNPKLLVGTSTHIQIRPPILQNWGILSLRPQVTFSIQQKTTPSSKLVPQCFSMCRVERKSFTKLLQKVSLTELIRLQRPEGSSNC